MSSISVLKFGGSFLRGPQDLLAAVDVIYARVRRGERLIAVTSAFHGRTDQLEQSLARLDAGRATPSSERVRAALLATGEVETANLLAAALGRAGVSAVCARVHRHGPFVGPGTEDPVGVDAESLRALLEEVSVICFPGFAAVEDSLERAPALLGRGGSDLTAVVLGRDLQAPVTLVKDVEGLYTSDPAARVAGEESPRRLSSVSFEDALALGDAILQPRAIRFARDHGLPFDVVGPGHVAGARGTTVHTAPTIERTLSEAPRPLRVTLLGLGTVGTRVFAQLSAAPERFEIVSILARELELDGPPHATAGLLAGDIEAALAAGPDLVIEAMEEHELAAAFMARALRGGAHVVGSGARAIALAAPRLDDVAREAGVSFTCSAAVGGALPALESVTRAALDEEDPLVGFEAALAGETSAAGALDSARTARRAEAGARGEMVVALELLARAAGWPALRWLPLDPLEDGAHADAPSPGRARFVGSVFRSEGGPVANVESRVLGPEPSPQGFVGPSNSLVLHRASGRTELLRGGGEGPWPIAAAIMGDVLSFARRASDEDAQLVTRRQ